MKRQTGLVIGFIFLNVCGFFVPPGTTGQIYFGVLEALLAFEYIKDYMLPTGD